MPGDRETVGVMPSERGTIQRGLASETRSPADAGAVARDAAAGNVAVVVLPPAGAG
jgi:hypothetical protein